MKRLRNFLKGASLTTALFIFQACYGTPIGIVDIPLVKFKVVSTGSRTPLQGIAIKARIAPKDNLDWNLLGYTNAEGVANVPVPISGTAPQFRIESESGQYIIKDTVIANLDNTIYIQLEKAK